MKNAQIILDTILARNIFDYVLLDKTLKVVAFSPHIEDYVGRLDVATDICDYFPELVGSEAYIQDIFVHPTQKFTLQSLYKHKDYIDITIAYYTEELLLLLVHNITESTASKQQILQYSNESILLSKTLETILNTQNILLFLTQDNQITFANHALLDYFQVDTLEALQQKEIKLYQYVDHTLEGYDALFSYVNRKELYVLIDNDTFILQVSMVEVTHKLFTLSKITDISKKLQYDRLTKTYKKEYFHQEVEKLIVLQQQAGVVVIDIDNFKDINEKYGYEIGDEVLQAFATHIYTQIEEVDILASWGGEAFLLLLKHNTLKESYTRAKALCLSIESYTFEKIGPITASFGVAEISPSDTLHSVLLRADKALYEAKREGKNTVVMKKLKKR